MAFYFKLSPFDEENKKVYSEDWWKVLLKLESLSREKLLELVEELWGKDAVQGMVSLDDKFLIWEIEEDIERADRVEKQKFVNIVEKKFREISSYHDLNQIPPVPFKKDDWFWINERLDHMDLLQLFYFYSLFDDLPLAKELRSFIKNQVRIAREITRFLLVFFSEE